MSSGGMPQLITVLIEFQATLPWVRMAPLGRPVVPPV